MPHLKPDYRWFALLLLVLPFWFDLNHEGSSSPHLGRYSVVPVLYAGLAGVSFLELATWIFRADRRLWSVDFLARIAAGGFLATSVVQVVSWLAEFGIGPTGALGGLFRAIGAGQAALDNSSLPFSVTVLAYTVSVGFVEESAKAFLALVDFEGDTRERAAIGFITGVGFGLVEGVLYSYRMYNGNSDWVDYLVRFVFCAGIHGCLTTFAVLLLAEAPDLEDNRTEWMIRGLLLAPAAFLHGLLDAYLTRNRAVDAFLVALATIVLAIITLWVAESREEDGCYG